MTHRISSLACFSVPWKRKSLFLRAKRIPGSIPCAHVLISYAVLLKATLPRTFDAKDVLVSVLQ